MEQPYINNKELRSFVFGHNLMNSYSVIHFNAIVSLTTAHNEILDRRMEVMIKLDEFDSLGKVTLMVSNINPLEYPTVFDAKWQKMEHKDNVYLSISDTHKMNPKIGKYVVKIVPLERLKD